MRHISVRKIRTLILILFIITILILTFATLSSSNSSEESDIVGTFGNVKELKENINNFENVENEMIEDDFTKSMNKDVNENDINDDDDTVNGNPDTVNNEKENNVDKNNNFNENGENEEYNNEDNVENGNDKIFDVNKDNNMNDDNENIEDPYDAGNVDNDTKENDDGGDDADDNDVNEDNFIDNNVPGGDALDFTVEDKNENDSDSNGDDTNNGDADDVDDVVDDTNNNNEPIGNDENNNISGNKIFDVNKDNNMNDDNQSIEDPYDAGNADDNNGNDDGDDVADDDIADDNAGEDDIDIEDDSISDDDGKKGDKEKDNVEFRLYHKGSNYRDKDDPKGIMCPVKWKWVKSKEKSDIIAMNVLDNLADIKRIENYDYDKSRQKLILMSMESVSNYKVMDTKRKFFDYTIDYRLDSDVPIPYTYGFFNFTKPALPTKEKGKKGRGLAAVFISNCNALNGRLKVLDALKDLIKVDSYGQCYHNKEVYEEDEDPNSAWNTKMNTISKYKFTFAFENSNDRDYVTEKFFQPLEAGSVPVFYGTSNIADFAPEHSYINVNDFESPQELAEYLKFLDQNDDAYEEYLAWKKKGDIGENLSRLVEIRKLNSICQLLQSIKGQWKNPYLTEWDRKDVPKDERACRLC